MYGGERKDHIMKRYYKYQYRNFGNTYFLCWAETPEQIKLAENPENGETWERITRKEAYELCAEENRRWKYDQSHAGYADSLIFPIDYKRIDYINDPRVVKSGYLVLYKKDL